jgi:hypothetical protein
MLIAPIPWAHRDWALPFCTALTPSERYYCDRGRRPGKLTDRARQMLLMVKRWLPQRDIVIVADSSFAAIELLAAVSAQVCVITRLRLDAALYEPAPPRRADSVGRPRRKGARLPTLQAVLANARTSWQTVTVTRWYSQGERPVKVVSGTALWYHAGKPVVPLRWVLVRDPQCRFKPQAFLCTDQTASPDQVLNWFVKRWQVEVTFEEARAHLGMETQRQWSARAIARTTLVVLALYSIIALLAKQRIGEQPIILRHAAWYEKEAATFSDTIALVRRWFWCKQALSISEGPSEMIKIPRPLFDRLTDTLNYAAWPDKVQLRDCLKTRWRPLIWLPDAPLAQEALPCGRRNIEQKRWPGARN